MSPFCIQSTSTAFIVPVIDDNIFFIVIAIATDIVIVIVIIKTGRR